MVDASYINDVICLVGPKSSGKTTLLYTWRKSFAYRSHGFTVNGLIKIDPISLAEAESCGVRSARFLGAVSGEFNDFAEAFLRKPEETDATTSYLFEVSQTNSPKRIVEVIDSAGELLIRSKGGDTQYSPEAKEQLVKGLSKAQTIIVAMPMVDLQMAPEFEAIQELVLGFTDVENLPNLRRLVLAFTHCERRLIYLGNQAFRYAADPKNLKALIEAHFEKMPWRDNVRAFATMPERDVFLTASGANGFLTGNGTVNIDPHAPSRLIDNVTAQALTGQISESERERGKYNENRFVSSSGQLIPWKPFLTADPFFCAILGVPGNYAIKLPGTFSREKVDPSIDNPKRKAAVEPSVDVIPKKEPLLSRFRKKLKQWTYVKTN